jgi:hypothetical protein
VLEGDDRIGDGTVEIEAADGLPRLRQAGLVVAILGAGGDPAVEIGGERHITLGGKAIGRLTDVDPHPEDLHQQTIPGPVPLSGSAT